ncbi:MAG: calcium/sodium antiporter [Hyphomicrobiales bacterium]
MLTASFLTLAGIALLLVAGDALVRGAIALSLKLGLSATLISVTVVALGTSAPEFVISIEAALDGSPDIALGNVVGSNIANTLLIIGVPALLAPLATGAPELMRNYLAMIFATVLFSGLALTGEFGRISGGVLLFALVVSLYYSYRASEPQSAGELAEDAPQSGLKITTLILLGIILLPVGAYLLIDGARGVAMQFELSEAAIGLTIVALGTSLPELAASSAAAMRGRGDVAIGSILGSNMLNLLLVLGATAAISPLVVAKSFQTVDIPIMAGACLLIGPFLLRHRPIGRVAGVAFVLFYAAFVILALGDVSF